MYTFSSSKQLTRETKLSRSFIGTARTDIHLCSANRSCYLTSYKTAWMVAHNFLCFLFWKFPINFKNISIFQMGYLMVVQATDITKVSGDESVTG